jgi:hypothetical protein
MACLPRGGLFGPAACIAGNCRRGRCRRGPLLRIFRPGHRDHASPLFVRQSQRERTLRAQPVVFNATRRAGLMAPPPQLRHSEGLRFHQKQFSLTQLAEGDGASWICAFVQHPRPPESAVLQPERALAGTRSSERCDHGAAWNQFEGINAAVYLWRFPKLKCPIAVSVAEIPADVMR